MKFMIRNQARLANKQLNFIREKVQSLSGKFTDVIYSEMYVKKVSHHPEVYAATVKMGVPGPDIVVSARSSSLRQLWASLSAKMKSQLRKYSCKK